MKTPIEARAAWIHALRSDRFGQCIGTLCKLANDVHPQHQYCCLGVACELAYEDGVPMVVKTDDHGRMYNDRSGALPDSVREWLGLRNPSGSYTNALGKTRSLTDDNDITRRPFTEIADIIELGPKGLFVDTEEIA